MERVNVGVCVSLYCTKNNRNADAIALIKILKLFLSDSVGIEKGIHAFLKVLKRVLKH